MATSRAETARPVQTTGVHFEDDVLVVSLSDGREIAVPLDRVEWLAWLKNATPEQRAHWSIEPRGFAVYWDDLDDGIEVAHLLDLEPLA